MEQFVGRLLARLALSCSPPPPSIAALPCEGVAELSQSVHRIAVGLCVQTTESPTALIRITASFNVSAANAATAAAAAVN